MASFILMIWLLRALASLEVMLQAMTGRDTPVARPSATLDGTKTYGTFCESAASASAGIEDADGAARCAASRANLVLAQQRQVQQNLNRLRIRRHDDELGDAPVQCLGGCAACDARHLVQIGVARVAGTPAAARTLVSTLLELLVIGCLLHQVQDGDGERGIGKWVGLRVGSAGGTSTGTRRGACTSSSGLRGSDGTARAMRQRRS